MKDILKSFFEASKERIKNPFIGTFLISWIAINWKPITILLLSSENIEKRINYIENYYTNISTYFLIPFLIALVYVIILPYFMWAIDELIRKSTIGRKKNLIKQTIYDYEGKQEIAIAESKLEDLKAKYRDKADFNNQIEQLRSQLDEREKIVQVQQAEINKYKKELTEMKGLIKVDNSEQDSSILDKKFSEFEKSDLYENFDKVGISMRNNRNFPNGINDILKEKFIVQDIVEEAEDENNFYYRFSNKGNYFWKKYLTKISVGKVIPEDLPF